MSLRTKFDSIIRNYSFIKDDLFPFNSLIEGEKYRIYEFHLDKVNEYKYDGKTRFTIVDSVMYHFKSNVKDRDSAVKLAAFREDEYGKNWIIV